MSLGLRLSLLPLLIAGCAAQLLEVPDSDWETVPAPTRAAVDRQIAADLAAAQTELAAATKGLAELQRSLPTAAAAPAPSSRAVATAPGSAAAKPTAPGDEFATAQQYHERARRDAFGRVEAAKAAWQRTDLAWRELRLAAAQEHIAVVVSQRELVRAQTIDHSLPGTDHYNVAPLRGQFSQAQQRWYTVASSARQARSAFEHASATLASAKEAYAQLMRDVPLSSSVAAIAPDDHPQLQLAGWAVSRADIRRRRGLRHFLDDVAGAPPHLRKVAVRLTVRSVPIAAVPAAGTAAAAPTAEANAGTHITVTTAGMHPADAAATEPSPGAAPKPGPPASTASSTGKPAPASAPTNPWDVARPTSPASASVPGSGKPAPGGAPASAPTAPATAGARSAPATAKPAPTAPAAAGAKPGPSTSAAAIPSSSKPAPPAAPASPAPAAGTTVAKAASPTSPAPASGKPTAADGKSPVAAPRANQPGAAPTAAAKPVD